MERLKLDEYGQCTLYLYENKTMKLLEVLGRGEGRWGRRWRG
jgi:hypothetical protein